VSRKAKRSADMRPASVIGRLDRPALARGAVRVYAGQREDGRETEDRQAPAARGHPPPQSETLADVARSYKCQSEHDTRFMTPDRFVGIPL
jgi:hypothetical protein